MSRKPSGRPTCLACKRELRPNFRNDWLHGHRLPRRPAEFIGYGLHGFFCTGPCAVQYAVAAATKFNGPAERQYPLRLEAEELARAVAKYAQDVARDLRKLDAREREDAARREGLIVDAEQGGAL